MNSTVNKIAGDKLYATDIMNIVSAVNSKQDSFNLSDYLLKSELPSLTGGTTDLSNYYTKPEIDGKGYLTSFNQDFRYESIIGKPDLSLYITGVTWDNIEAKPEIPDSYSKIESDLKYLSTGTSLFSGNYDDLINKPTIPSTTGLASEQWVNEQGFLKSFTQDFDYNKLTNKPDLTLYLTGVTWNQVTEKPVIPSIAGLASESFVITSLNGYSLTGHTHTFASLTSKPTTLSGYGITDAVSSTALASKADLSLTINSRTTNYALVLADNGKFITMNLATANTLTIPTNASVALPVGSQIILQQEGAGQTTVSGASGVTIQSLGAKTKLASQYSTATLIKKATNIWALIGDLA